MTICCPAKLLQTLVSSGSSQSWLQALMQGATIAMHNLEILCNFNCSWVCYNTLANFVTNELCNVTSHQYNNNIAKLRSRSNFQDEHNQLHRLYLFIHSFTKYNKCTAKSFACFFDDFLFCSKKLGGNIIHAIIWLSSFCWSILPIEKYERGHIFN